MRALHLQGGRTLRLAFAEFSRRNFNSSASLSAGAAVAVQLKRCESFDAMAKQANPHNAEGLSRPTFNNGRFGNPWESWHNPSVGSLMKFMSTRWENTIPKKEALDRLVPVLPLDRSLVDNPPIDSLQMTWLGHSTCLVQMEGLSIITDPVFSERCFSSQWFGPKRFRPTPCSVSELPPLDAVLISHDHYDHLDAATVKAIGNGPTWYVPQGFGPFMECQDIKNYVEMGWWDEKQHSANLTVAAVPAQHWGQRIPIWDKDTRLWMGFVLSGRNGRFYYAGDTGYCPAFKEIGQVYGPIDLCAIPIGAGVPRDFMQAMHINEEDAVKVHQDVKAVQSIGIHWGTFPMTDEAADGPPKILSKALEANQISPDSFVCLQHGETHVVSFPCLEGSAEA